MSPITSRRLSNLALLSLAVLAVTACGGGGGDGGNSGGAPPSSLTPSPPPPPPSATASGLVMVPIAATGVSTVGPATVCYDTNKSGTCDTDEPTTSTDVQGAYTLTGLPSVQAADVAIVAQIPAGTGPSFTVQTPAAKPALVNTITSMVQTGVAQGMTLAAAEAAVAQQLQISAAGVYANYRELPVGAERAWYNTFATFITQNLQTGVPLRVGPPATQAAPDYHVSSFSFSNGPLGQTQALNIVYSTGVADAATGLVPYYLLSESLVNGTPQPPTSSPAAWTLSPEGWKLGYSQAYTQLRTAGNPYVTLSANGYRSIASAQEIDVSGESVSSVITRVTSVSATTNTYSTVTLPSGLTAGSFPGTMPSGASVRVIRAASMVTPAQYREADHINTTSTTLAGMLAVYPALAAGVAADNSNSVLFGRVATSDPSGSRGCSPSFITDSAGNLICPNSDTRATFDASAGLANFYLCDYMFDVTPGSLNCRNVGTADIALGTLADGLTPSMSFSTLPSAASSALQGRVLVQRTGKIYKTTPASRATATTYTISTALNGTAFARLSSTAPNPTFTSPSPYMGLWHATYAGNDSGTCNLVLVDAAGNLSGPCQAASGVSFTLGGSVVAAGSALANAIGSSTNFTGLFTATTATGTWRDSSTFANGTWSATKY